MAWLSRLRTETGRTATAGIASAVAIQIGLVVTGIVLARALGPADRGHFAFVTLLPFIFTQVGTLGIPLSLTYTIATNGRLLAPVNALAWRACPIQAIVLVVACAAVLFPLIWGRGADTRIAAAVGIGVIPVQLVSVYALAILQGARRVLAYYALRTLMTAGWVVALGLFLVFDQLTVVSASVSYTFAVAITAVLATTTARRKVPREAPTSEIEPRHSMARLLRPAWPVRLAADRQRVSARPGDRRSLPRAGHPGSLRGRDELYELPRFIGVSLGALAYPNVARESDPKRALRVLWRYLGITLIASSAFVVPCIVFAPDLVPALFGPSFASADGLVRILLLGALFVAAQRVLIEGARGLNRPGVGSVSELGLLLTLVVLSAIFLPTGGVTAIAWAMVVAAVVGCAIALAGVLNVRRRSEAGRPASSKPIAPSVEASEVPPA